MGNKWVREASSKLTAFIISPAVCGAACGESTGLTDEASAGRYGAKAKFGGNGGRQRTRANTAIAELTAIVATPAQRNALPRQSARVLDTRGDSDEFQRRHDSCRCVAICGGAVAELAVRVLTPTKRGTITHEAARISATGSQTDERETSSDDDWRHAARRRAGVRHTHCRRDWNAQLTALTTPPAVCGAHGRQGASVRSARGN